VNLPTDHEICSLVFRMWRGGMNLELRSIALCMASNKRIDVAKEYDAFEKHIHTRLKALVRSGDLRRVRFLPGRPNYYPS
jgi:hypothetical protein